MATRPDLYLTPFRRNAELAVIRSEALPAAIPDRHTPALNSHTVTPDPISSTVAKRLKLKTAADAISSRSPIQLPDDMLPTKTPIVLVLGRSGSGKSTILRQLAAAVTG